MYHKERRGNTINMANRRDLLKKIAIPFKAAVFGFAILPPPGAGIFQERHEVGDADNIDACRPEFGIGRHGSEYHEATVAAAHHCYASGIGKAAFNEILHSRFQVCNKIHTQAYIVKALIFIAVAWNCRAHWEQVRHIRWR